jgi:single-strand DNA-binding protein
MKVARLGLAVNERRRDRTGQIQEFPVFVEVDAWDKLAELCGQYLSKGRSILVEGRLQMDSWEKDGMKHQKLKVRASTIKFLPQGDRLNGGPRQQPQQWQSAESMPPVASFESDSDDIPF